MKLLIADDHAAFRQMLKNFLGSVSTDVVECADGGEAVVRYAQEKPDWVLMDIEMKPMDGMTAMRQIKARFPSARILIVTNHDDAELRAAARQAGAADYVLKENLRQVREIISSRPSSDSLRNTKPSTNV